MPARRACSYTRVNDATMVAYSRAPEEAAQLAVEIAAEQPRIPRHHRVCGVHPRVPVDLVQAQRGVPLEAATGDAVDPIGDQRCRLRRQPELAPRAPGVREAVDH